ncbi:MAG TPA: hypothetical protein VIL30_00715, partial [Ramlibacter sp.]
MMIPVDVAPLEARQFELLLKRSGADPGKFKLRKLAHADGTGYKVRVVGRGAATVYDAVEPGEWTGRFAADLQSGVFGMKGAAQPQPRVAAALGEIEHELARRGLLGALQVLNARVPHRFTGVYRLDGPLLRNVALADKHLHLEPVDLRVVPFKDSFCQFALRDGLFLTCESGNDERLVGHPYSGVVGCYVGVPIARADGAMAGTLCHFDLSSHPIEDDEFLL